MVTADIPGSTLPGALAGGGDGRRFHDLSLLGTGAFGRVYRARDVQLELDVAIKCIGHVSPDAVASLKREFRAAASILHPNLVQLHELFVDGGDAFFSMELVDGLPLLDWIAQHAASDPALLCDLAAQLCEAIAALHGGGLVHRDVKPANVMVTSPRRLVLLDFGFLADVRAIPAAPAHAEGLVGTFAYMAPEQLGGEKPVAAGDVYAAGSVLYEALTGSPPPPWLGGGDVELELPPSTPAALAEAIPAMLRADAAARPSAAHVAALLRSRDARSLAAAEPVFVGRAEETEWLRTNLARGAGIVVEICGASGVGKSDLVRHCLADLDPRAALVLRSRCRITESVPFQALDAAMEELSVELLNRTSRDREVEAAAGRAGILFPSFGRLASGTEHRNPDPIDARAAATAGIRTLLAAAGERSVVVWIDDAQWADADSVALICELAAGTDARVRWILTSRVPAGQCSVLGSRLEQMASADGAGVSYDRLELQPLCSEEAEQLVRLCAGDIELSDEEVRRLARASDGFPFLLTSYAALLGEGIDASLAGSGFAPMLAHAFAGLEHQERVLLELVALCPEPTEQKLVLEAAGIGPRGVPALRRLEARRLIRTSPAARGVMVDSYHDQVPETLLRSLPSEAVRGGHARLARVLEGHGAEPAILAHHCHGAGELDAASRHAEVAAAAADAALAFARAAELYRNARQWSGAGGDERAALLLEREAGALANAGSLAVAGERYLAAAARVRGHAALELRRSGVESLLAGGRIERGLDELRELSSHLSLRYPRSEASAMAGAVGALGGYLLRSRWSRRSAASALETLRIDTCYSVGRRLADVDPSRGSYFLAASLRRAAGAGDRQRLARSLCTAGGALGAVGGRTINRIGDAMMADAARIAAEIGSEELGGMIDIAYGEIDMLAGRWAAALERSRSGVARLLRKPGYVFECNVGRGVVLRVLEELGQWQVECEEGHLLLREAQAHHNVYVEIRAAQHLTMACLALGRTAEARSYLSLGFDRWTEGGLYMQHLYALRNAALCDLYEDRVDEGRSHLEEAAARFRTSVLRQIPLIRIDMAWLRGQLALAAAARDRARSLAEAQDAARQLERERRADADVRAALLRAGVRSMTDTAAAAAMLSAASTQADALGMQALAHCAKYRAARWSGDAEATGAAAKRLSITGIAEPERYARFVVPGAGAHA